MLPFYFNSFHIGNNSSEETCNPPFLGDFDFELCGNDITELLTAASTDPIMILYVLQCTEIQPWCNRCRTRNSGKFTKNDWVAFKTGLVEYFKSVKGASTRPIYYLTCNKSVLPMVATLQTLLLLLLSEHQVSYYMAPVQGPAFLEDNNAAWTVLSYLT